MVAFAFKLKNILNWFLPVVVHEGGAATARESNDLVEETSSRVGTDQVTHDAHGSGTHPHQSHIVRISSEHCDVSVYPEQCQVLVMQSQVTRSIISLQRQPAQWSQPAVNTL